MISQKIKIIHIITKLELGGAQQTTLYTLSHLDQSHYLPVLICGQGGILLPEAIMIPGLKVYICPELEREISPFKDLRAVISLWRILLKEKLAHNGHIIIHTHSSKAGILGRCSAFLAGIPIRIHTVHGFGFNPYQSFFLRWALILAEVLTGFFTTEMIYVSRDNLKEGLRLGISQKKNSCIIRSGIDKDKFLKAKTDRISVRAALGIPVDSRLIGMVACFKPQKALFDFIRTARLVNIKFPGTHFILIGDGELRGDIEKMISNLNLKKNIHLTGWRRDIPELIGAMDIMLLTSLWEGLPKVVLEAQLMGVPVIATKTSGVGEVIRDGISGFITPQRRPDIMASRIIELLREPENIIKMGQQGKSVSREFDLEYIILKHDKLYRDLLAVK